MAGGARTAGVHELRACLLVFPVRVWSKRRRPSSCPPLRLAPRRGPCTQSSSSKERRCKEPISLSISSLTSLPSYHVGARWWDASERFRRAGRASFSKISAPRCTRETFSAAITPMAALTVLFEGRRIRRGSAERTVEWTVYVRPTNLAGGARVVPRTTETAEVAILAPAVQAAGPSAFEKRAVVELGDFDSPALIAGRAVGRHAKGNSASVHAL